MGNNGHARLAPSAAKRWINCPGSVREIEKLPSHERNRTSSYADEGSAAHALAEKCLRERCHPEDFAGWFIVTDPIQGWRVASAHEIEARTDKPQCYEIDTEMIEAVATYVDFVREEWAKMGPGTELLIEEKVQPVPGLDSVWGTADAILYKPYSKIVVCDYKHGKGVVVEVDFNEQAQCYGLGALNRVGGALDVDEIELVIVQPRAPHEEGVIRRWSIDPTRLAEWGDVLRAAALRTEEPDAPLHSGDWCRFCPALALCPEVRKRAQQEAAVQFADVPVPVEPETKLPVPTEPEQLARALNIIGLLDAWARECEGMAQRFLEAGVEIPGYKLVRKRANRVWKDEEAVLREMRRLEELGAVEAEDYLKIDLRSPAQLEKLKALGKNPAERKEWVARYAEKPEGGLTIAHISDARPAVAPPIPAQFAALFEETDAEKTQPLLAASVADDNWLA